VRHQKDIIGPQRNRLEGEGMSAARCDQVCNRFAASVKQFTDKELDQMRRHEFRCAVCGHPERGSDLTELRERARAHARSHAEVEA
jgi:hypothetical protein